MKKSLLILTVVLFSFFIITSCSEDPILTPPDKDSPQNALSMKMPTVDTTVTATPEAFFQLHNDLIPVNPDTTLTYVWEVVSSSSPSSNWVFSICNPMACVAPGTLRSEFSFTHGIPGYFWVDWSNKDTVLDSLKTGDCALTVRIFAKNGGDTLLYTSVMHVTK